MVLEIAVILSTVTGCVDSEEAQRLQPLSPRIFGLRVFQERAAFSANSASKSFRTADRSAISSARN